LNQSKKLVQAEVLSKKNKRSHVNL